MKKDRRCKRRLSRGCLSGLAAQAATGPQVDDIVTGIALVLVGFIAGVLGGPIGTGGCSVMLPIIHFWMGYPVWAHELVTVLLILPPKFGRLPGSSRPRQVSPAGEVLFKCRFRQWRELARFFWRYISTGVEMVRPGIAGR